MDHTHLITVSLLGFVFLTLAALGTALARKSRTNSASKRKVNTPALTEAHARAIAAGEMHPLTAWRLGAGVSCNALGTLAQLSPDAVRAVETTTNAPDPATAQAIAAALLTIDTTLPEPNASCAHPAGGADTTNASAPNDGGNSAATSRDGGGASE